MWCINCKKILIKLTKEESKQDHWRNITSHATNLILKPIPPKLLLEQIYLNLNNLIDKKDIRLFELMQTDILTQEESSS